MSTTRVLQRECEKRHLQSTMAEDEFGRSICVISNSVGVVYTGKGETKDGAIIHALKQLGPDPFVFSPGAHSKAKMHAKTDKDRVFNIRQFDQCVNCGSTYSYLFDSLDQPHTDNCPWAERSEP